MAALLKRTVQFCPAFWRSARGATAIEYALIASLIAMVIIGAVTGLGGSVLAMFDNTATALQ